MEINTAIAGRAVAGEALTEAELIELQSADLLSLGMLADDVRRRRVGTAVTFARVCEVGVADVEAAEIPAAAGEVRLTGVPASMARMLGAVRTVRTLAGTQRRLTGFALTTLALRASEGWGALPAILAALKDAGLDAVESLPIDRVGDVASLTAALAESGLPVRALTVDTGSGVSTVDLVLRARAIAASVAIGVVAPLARSTPADVPTTGYADVRSIALARVGLPGIPVIQVDWRRQGPKLSQIALTFGANDIDGVPPIDDDALGWRRASVEEVRRQVAVAGFTPHERNRPA